MKYQENEHFAITTSDGRYICETFDSLDEAVEVWSKNYVSFSVHIDLFLIISKSIFFTPPKVQQYYT